MSVQYINLGTLQKVGSKLSTQSHTANIMIKSDMKSFIGVNIMQDLSLDTNQIYLILIAVISISLIMIKVFFPEFFSRLFKLLKRYSAEIMLNEGIHDDSLDEILNNLGYSYDYFQDIFYSDINAWQREMGYTRLYDEAAAPMSMIIDCEPIYFEYDNRQWLVEFWK